MLELYLNCNSAFHTSVVQVTVRWSPQIKGGELCPGSNNGDAEEHKNPRANESQWKSKMPLLSTLTIHLLGNLLKPSPADVEAILLVCFPLVLGHSSILDMSSHT